MPYEIHQLPYADLHSLNLDWIIKQLKQQMVIPTAVTNEGLQPYAGRAAIVTGGYVIMDKTVFVNLDIILTSDLTKSNFWPVLAGFPKPVRSSALACAGGALHGGFNSYVNTNGELTICTGAEGLVNGNTLSISGLYFIG